MLKAAEERVFKGTEVLKGVFKGTEGVIAGAITIKLG